MTHMQLPAGYVVFRVIDTVTDRRLVRLLGITGIAAAALMFASAVFFFPFSDFVSFSAPNAAHALRLALLVPAIFIYMLTHELIHALFMRILGKKKPVFKFSGLYMHVGSEVYFDKKSGAVVLAAPVLILFVILMILGIIFRDGLFWFFYILQMVNIAASAGDLYMLACARKAPHGCLVRLMDYKEEIYCMAQPSKNR